MGILNYSPEWWVDIANSVNNISEKIANSFDYDKNEIDELVMAIIIDMTQRTANITTAINMDKIINNHYQKFEVGKKDIPKGLKRMVMSEIKTFTVALWQAIKQQETLKKRQAVAIIKTTEQTNLILEPKTNWLMKKAQIYILTILAIAGIGYGAYQYSKSDEKPAEPVVEKIKEPVVEKPAKQTEESEPNATEEVVEASTVKVITAEDVYVANEKIEVVEEDPFANFDVASDDLQAELDRLEALKNKSAENKKRIAELKEQLAGNN